MFLNYEKLYFFMNKNKNKKQKNSKNSIKDKRMKNKLEYNNKYNNKYDNKKQTKRKKNNVEESFLKVILKIIFIITIFFIITFLISNYVVIKNINNESTNNNTKDNIIRKVNNTPDNSLNNSFLEVKETVNTIIKNYTEKKEVFAVYDPYNKILYYGFKINKSTPCSIVLTEEKMTRLKKNYVDVNLNFKTTSDFCIQTISEEYVFRKSIFLEQPQVLRIYKNNTLILQKNITILNFPYKKNIKTYEDLNSYCKTFSEEKRAECCSENSYMLPRIMCVGTWVWDDGCKYKCGLEQVN